HGQRRHALAQPAGGFGGAVEAQQPHQGLTGIAAGKAGEGRGGKPHLVVEVAPPKACPVDERHEGGQAALGRPHAVGEHVRMRPLHVPKILIVERRGQGAAPVLEGVNGAVLAVEKRLRNGQLA
nr:hypothetical protein [Tanacetum cinerariifolium]